MICRITDVFGHSLYSTNIISNPQRLEISSFSAGVYFLVFEIRSKERSFYHTEKLIKN
jgi:hypothetical protein